MDGNGRWAKTLGFGRSRGHREGAKRVDDIAQACVDFGVRYLTLYAFSTENWHRPPGEVNMLWRLLVQHLKTLDKKLIRNRIALQAQGSLERLPGFALRELERVRRITSQYEPRLVLTLCLSYGGRQEIVDAARSIARQAAQGELNPDLIDERLLGSRLYQPGVPDPDLLIRTGGEYRVSNFLLWQIAYAEFYVTETLWPDFDKRALWQAIEAFGGRERRFGRTSEQLTRPEGAREGELT